MNSSIGQPAIPSTHAAALAGAGPARQGMLPMLVQGVLLLAGVFSAALGLKGFLLPNGFIDGGVTGMSLLVSQLTGVSLSVLIVVINIPFIMLGYYQLGRMFALKTLLTILALAGALLLVSFPGPHPGQAADCRIRGVLPGGRRGPGHAGRRRARRHRNPGRVLAAGCPAPSATSSSSSTSSSSGWPPGCSRSRRRCTRFWPTCRRPAPSISCWWASRNTPA